MNYSSLGLFESSFVFPIWKQEEIAEFQSIIKKETGQDMREEEPRTYLMNLYDCFRMFIYED